MGFGVWGLGFGVWGLGFGVPTSRFGYRRFASERLCLCACVRSFAPVRDDKEPWYWLDPTPKHSRMPASRKNLTAQKKKRNRTPSPTKGGKRKALTRAKENASPELTPPHLRTLTSFTSQIPPLETLNVNPKPHGTKTLLPSPKTRNPES